MTAKQIAEEILKAGLSLDDIKAEKTKQEENETKMAEARLNLAEALAAYFDLLMPKIAPFDIENILEILDSVEPEFIISTKTVVPSNKEKSEKSDKISKSTEKCVKSQSDKDWDTIVRFIRGL